MNVTILPKPPRVGLVSLGCPKALVDSERIMTKLRADGYDMSPDYAGADVVLVNTCGFLDSAKEESLEAIGEAIAENGRVVVTGCMGKEADDQALAGAHPLDAMLGLVGDLDDVITGEVGQLHRLEVGPQPLDWVEVGRIRRQPLG